MRSPSSLDLRERVVSAVAGGMSWAAAGSTLSGECLLGQSVDQKSGGDWKCGCPGDGRQEAIPPGRGGELDP